MTKEGIFYLDYVLMGLLITRQTMCGLDVPINLIEDLGASIDKFFDKCREANIAEIEEKFNSFNRQYLIPGGTSLLNDFFIWHRDNKIATLIDSNDTP